LTCEKTLLESTEKWAPGITGTSTARGTSIAEGGAMSVEILSNAA